MMTRQKDTEMTSGRYHVYANAAGCRTCPVRAACTSGAYRRINVHEHAETVAAARAPRRQTGHDGAPPGDRGARLWHD
jgi:hypothetical protein